MLAETMQQMNVDQNRKALKSTGTEKAAEIKRSNNDRTLLPQRLKAAVDLWVKPQV
jgi:hypothetical protein